MIGCQVAVGGISAATLTDGYITVVLFVSCTYSNPMWKHRIISAPCILWHMVATKSAPNIARTHKRPRMTLRTRKTPLTFESTAFPLNAISLFLHLMLFYANIPGNSMTYIPANPPPRTGKRKLDVFCHLAANTGNNPRALPLATSEQWTDFTPYQGGLCWPK